MARIYATLSFLLLLGSGCVGSDIEGSFVSDAPREEHPGCNEDSRKINFSSPTHIFNLGGHTVEIFASQGVTEEDVNFTSDLVDQINQMVAGSLEIPKTTRFLLCPLHKTPIALPTASPPVVRLSMREFHSKDKPIDRFGGTAAHEYGHVLFNKNFKSESKTFASFLRDSATTADLGSYPGKMDDYSLEQLQEVSDTLTRLIPALALNYYTSALPFPQELFADSLSAIFLIEPTASIKLKTHDQFEASFLRDEILTRDMSKAHPVPSTKHPSHHAMSAPIRNVVWRSFMKPSGPDLESRGQILGRLMEAISEVEEARRKNWDGNLILISAPDAKDWNARLRAAIEASPL